PVAVLDRAKLKEALQGRPGPGEGPVAPAGGDQGAVVRDLLTARELDELPLGVDGTGADSQPEGDALLGVVVDRLDQLLLEARLPAQVLLRQSRAGTRVPRRRGRPV